MTGRLAEFGTTIFAEMSALAARTGAINLGQGYPDTDGPAEIMAAVESAMRSGQANQYAPIAGVPELCAAIAEHQGRRYGLAVDPRAGVQVTFGAPEAIAGVKLLTVPAPDGKLTPDLITRRIARVGDEHAAQARVVSITQTTELGTLYTLDELAALPATAREHGLLVHMDGARFLNAVEALGCTFADLAEGAMYLRKQTLQLASKMRFVAAQFEALLRDDTGLRAVGNANAMARRLAAAIQRIDGVRITQAVQANVVFAILPPEATERLQRDWRFYTWDEHTGEVRWMCAWDTTPDDVDAFAAAVADAVGAAVA